MGVALAVMVVTTWQHRHAVTTAYQAGTQTHVPDVLPREMISRQAWSPVGTSPLALPTVPDSSRTPLIRFAGPEDSAASADVGTGSLHLGGLVRDAEGPVAGATVILERFVPAGTAQVERYTNEDGRWELSGVAGGRWRIRAFVPQIAASPGSQVYFFADGDTAELVHDLIAPSRDLTMQVTAPADTIVGTDVVVVVTVAGEQVTDDGRRELVGRAGHEVQLRVDQGSAVELISAGSVVTDAAGQARFALRCHMTGPSRGVIEGIGMLEPADGNEPVDGSDGPRREPQRQYESVSLPACRPVPPPPETDSAETGASDDPSNVTPPSDEAGTPLDSESQDG